MRTGGIFLKKVKNIHIMFDIGKILGDSGVRKDIATPLNSGEQYAQFISAADALAKKYKLVYSQKPGSIAELMAMCAGKKETVILSGEVSGRKVSLSVLLAGDAFATKLECSGTFALPIDVIIKSMMHLSGMGMELRYMGGMPIEFGRIQVRPEFQKDAEITKKALNDKFCAACENLIFLKPETANLSSQIGDYNEKKFTVMKDKAFLRDYGLPRDKKYLLALADSFLKIASAWENKKIQKEFF